MVGLVTAIILIPLLGAVAVCTWPPASAEATAGRLRNGRPIALMFNIISAGCALALWRNFDATATGLQFVERHAWIPAINAEYLVGVDGLSLLLVLLTSLIIPFALLAQPAPDGSRAFYATMLVMQSALYGTFTAQNFVLWFLFYEMSLIPGFLLIKIWGGENRDRAATKFFLYTFLGSVAMLLSFLGIYLAKGTFDFAALASLGKSGLLTGNFAWVAFAGIFVGLAVKVPLFPFHTWLPDAYQTAPTGVSMVLTGVLSKMGVYGFVRLLLPLFPNEIKIIGPWLLALVVCSIVFAPLAAWAQRDLKRMIAYLSINHLGYCMLGLFALAASPDCCCDDRHAGGVEWRVHANLQSRHYRGGAFLLCGPARTTARSAWHRRFRWPDAADTAALRLDECRHVFVARFAGAERIYWRVFDFQRLIRDGGGVHGHCCDRPSRHSDRFYASDAIAV